MTSAYCTNCGAELAGGRFCTRCGAAVPDAAAPAERPLPPLRPLAPLAPIAPAKRTSPWPWIGVGAAVALVAGGVTAWLVVGHSTSGSADAATGGPSLGTVSSPASATDPSTPVVGGASNVKVGNDLRDLVKQDTVRHDAYNKALGDLKDFCAGANPGADVTALVSSVTTFPTARQAYARRAQMIAAGAATAEARSLAARLAALEQHLAADAGYGVRWAKAVQPSGACAPYHQELAYASKSVSDERATWVNDFKAYASAAHVSVTELQALFDAKTGL
jgi:hypothetical protein